MSFRQKSFIFVVAAFLIVLPARPAAAEEIVLKDGKKITGTIVGFENGMFKVETEFGYALIRKDKVASINMLAGGDKEGTKKDEKNVEERTTPSVGSEKTGRAEARKLTPSPPPARPLNEPLPPHLAEHVEGNKYFSDTFHFVMYKPPDWKLFEELPREKVSAIVVLSSEDERTLLFVDRQVWSGAPNLNDDVVEENLRRTYQNYKKLSETDLQVDGLPSIRRTFTGVVDEVEWHGISVRMARGNAVFGIIGLTSDEAFQFREAVFNKIVNSFHFLAPQSEAAAAAHTGPTP